MIDLATYSKKWRHTVAIKLDTKIKLDVKLQELTSWCESMLGFRNVLWGVDTIRKNDEQNKLVYYVIVKFRKEEDAVMFMYANGGKYEAPK
jgi:hypothetical protein